MFMDFKTFEHILLTSGWGKYYSGLTFAGEVKFFKGKLETCWFYSKEPVVGMFVMDRSGQFSRNITFNIPRDRMERTLEEWLSEVELEYKLFGL